MKSVILFFLVFITTGFALDEHGLIRGSSSDSSSSESLVFESTDHALLNETVFRLINKERTNRKLDTLKFNAALHQLARKNQSVMEFRTFKNVVKIQTKINKKLSSKAKLAGYKGGLTASVVSQHNAINYEKGKVFFHVKNDKDNVLGLYYGTKKDLKNPAITPPRIHTYTYEEFAASLLKNLTSKQKKILYSKSYQDLGLQLNWYYKSLHKRKIPQIKLVVILGGYMTAGMRN
jgi:hypothetical protein